jgi:septum formation protein
MLVLASASPRRQELLRNADIPFTVQPADIDETPLPGESPRECAQRLAREKAFAVFQNRPQDCILGADTIVMVDDMILGKPRDADHAFRMLRMLSGRRHAVITGVCLAGSFGKAEPLRTENRELRIAFEKTASETTLVTMCELSDQEIREYIATGEPLDKAGAYAIQGIASRWIPRIEGDYSNVVGLPVAWVYGELKKRGFV